MYWEVRWGERITTGAEGGEEREAAEGGQLMKKSFFDIAASFETIPGEAMPRELSAVEGAPSEDTVLVAMVS